VLHVALVAAAVQDLGNVALEERRAREHRKHLALDESRHEREIGGDEADPQRRSDELGVAADVDDVPQAIDLCEAHRGSLVHITVHVILHHRETVLLGEREDAVTVGGVGARAGRVVHQRLHEEGARAVRTAGSLQRLEIGPIGVTRHADQPHVVGAQLLEEHEVARVLHQHRVPG